VQKVGATIHELETLVVPEMPEVEDEAVVTEGRGVGSSHKLFVAYDRLLEGLDRVMQYHFELLNLGYGAYLVFHQLCRDAFPDISDQTIAKMISGIELLVLRPDEELKRLARRAVELGVAGAVEGAADEQALRAALAGSKAGAQWLADFDATKDPWFCFSNGNGLYHHHGSWIDDTRLPVAAIGAYVRRLRAGEEISRPSAVVLAERERITDEHRSLLAEGLRQPFDESLELGRTVFPFVENHNYYVEHRYFTLFWNKVREFGALLVRHGFLAAQEDVFYLRHDEVRKALEELRLHWSSGGAGVARGPGYWPPIVDRRKSIHDAMRDWAPPPALGRVPETITDPITVMLFGITDERIRDWRSSSNGGNKRTLTGFAASPGVAEGRARVIVRTVQLGELEDGEILVAPSTSPSWTPVFGRIAAAVLDSGGIMCHAAIVAREYGLQAVIGTGSATKRIKTGDLLRVDADSGVVEILA
jgi:pyruvate,water dikinase